MSLVLEKENIEKYLTNSSEYDKKVIEQFLAKCSKNKKRNSVKEVEKKYVLDKIVHQDLFNLYLKQRSVIWTEKEIKLEKDRNDFLKLEPKVKNFIKFMLAFFANADGLIMENINSNLQSLCPFFEGQLFFTVQNYIEGIHSITYANFIKELIDDPKEKEHLFNAIKTIKTIKAKADWYKKYMDKNISYAEKIIASTIAEAINFQSAFASIDWIYENLKIMGGLKDANIMISRDEGIHTTWGITLYNKLEKKDKITTERILEILDECVQTEFDFIDEILTFDLKGMNKEILSNYVKYSAKRFLQEFNIKVSEKYDISIDILPHYLSSRGLSNRTNFFEKQPTEYELNKSAEIDHHNFEGVDF